MLPANARQAHQEMADVPLLDKGAYVLLGNDDLFLRLVRDGAGPDAIRDYVAWTLARHPGAGGQDRQPRRDQRLQVQRPQARPRRGRPVLRDHAAHHPHHPGRRADRARRAAPDPRPRLQPRRRRRRRHHARHHRRHGRPAASTSPTCSSTATARRARPASPAVPPPSPSWSTAAPTSRSTSARSCSARPSPRPATR